MPVLDFDMGMAKKIGDLYTSPVIPVEFMPEDLFTRKRIVDKIRAKETFSFISFWRSGFTFDLDRFDPASMFDAVEGYYNDPEMTSATMFKIFPVVFNYSLVYWDTKRESIDFNLALLLKSVYSNPIISIIASDYEGLQMNCYMDFDYKLDVTDEYGLEKEEKVPYFKSKVDIKLEGWLYDASVDDGLINYIHTFIYNQNNFSFEDIWVSEERDPDPGLPDGYPI